MAGMDATIRLVPEVDMSRSEIIPLGARPGQFKVVVKAARTAREAGDPYIASYPVLAWVVYWFTPDSGDFGHPMVVEPLFLTPAAEGNSSANWQSDWDYGCATTPTAMNHGRAFDDRYDWKVVEA